ncbi:hypothetical protein HBB16_01495 [Pseudonocardia sp. MCCB 268]|nr:hypothetical protein [Pseudonocardia cytotoxica]
MGTVPPAVRRTRLRPTTRRPPSLHRRPQGACHGRVRPDGCHRRTLATCVSTGCATSQPSKDIDRILPAALSGGRRRRMAQIVEEIILALTGWIQPHEGGSMTGTQGCRRHRRGRGAGIGALSSGGWPVTATTSSSPMPTSGGVELSATLTEERSSVPRVAAGRDGRRRGATGDGRRRGANGRITS